MKKLGRIGKPIYRAHTRSRISVPVKTRPVWKYLNLEYHNLIVQFWWQPRRGGHIGFWSFLTGYFEVSVKKAPPGFEPGISCLLDRRFNQLSHGARYKIHSYKIYLTKSSIAFVHRFWAACAGWNMSTNYLKKKKAGNSFYYLSSSLQGCSLVDRLNDKHYTLWRYNTNQDVSTIMIHPCI